MYACSRRPRTYCPLNLLARRADIRRRYKSAVHALLLSRQPIPSFADESVLKGRRIPCGRRVCIPRPWGSIESSVRYRYETLGFMSGLTLIGASTRKVDSAVNRDQLMMNVAWWISAQEKIAKESVQYHLHMDVFSNALIKQMGRISNCCQRIGELRLIDF